MVYQAFFLALLAIYVFILIILWFRRLPHRTQSQPSRTELPLDQWEGDVVLEGLNIEKAFEDPVLKGVSFKVHEGETVGVLGASGSGKSVLLKLIAGFLKPDHGWIFFKGRDVAVMAERELLEVRKRVSYVFQHGAVFDFLTVAENIAYPLQEQGVTDEKEIARRVEYLLDAVELEGMGDDTYDELTAGGKKQVAIARAIANNPEVILYDEPTTGIDPIIGKSLSRLIRKLNQQENLTSVVVTHDMKCMEIVADRVVLIRDGELYFEGTVPEILASDDPYVRAFVYGKRYQPLALDSAAIEPA